MIYGYARVSTEAQDLTGSTAQRKAAGCQKIFREKITGTTADRPQLKKLIAALAHGDVVIIPAVDRLSRDTTDLLVIAREMQRAGAGIRSLAEPFLDTTSDFAEIVFAILSVAAKLEHRRIKNARHEAAPTRRPKASNSDASRSSPRTSSAKQSGGATWTGKRCAPSVAATMSARRRFRG
jgi:DNA invertase Pin-like site-specific DNA recombinase